MFGKNKTSFIAPGEWLYLPADEADKPSHLAKCYCGCWWAFVPGKGFVFWRANKNASIQAQCHRSQTLFNLIGKRVIPADAEVVHMPVVFVPRQFQ